MIDCRDCDPDRIMAAFLLPLHSFTRKIAMSDNIPRIRQWASEARSRNESKPIRLDVGAVLGDIDFLCEQHQALTDQNVLLKAELATAKRQAAQTQDLARQINGAMSVLIAAKVPDMGGDRDSRLARRVKLLANMRDRSEERSVRGLLKLEDETNRLRRLATADSEAISKQLAAARQIISEAHEALNVAKVPKADSTLSGRLNAVIVSWKRDDGIRKVLTKCGALHSVSAEQELRMALRHGSGL